LYHIILKYIRNMINSNENSLVKLKNTSSVDLPSEYDADDVNAPEGVGVARQNFYFSVLNKGSQSMSFEFKSTAYESLDNFKITINININSRCRSIFLFSNSRSNGRCYCRTVTF